MEDIRSGNMSVKRMKEEIVKEVTYLELRYKTKRSKRQIEDGNKFLEMISKAPYASCKKISTLKKMISEKRDAIKKAIIENDKFMPGHQFTFFENSEEISDEERNEVLEQNKRLKEEAHWLHKCLGMSCNRNYFK